MLADAKSEILGSGEYAPTGDVARMAGYGENDPSAHPSLWIIEGSIFAIDSNGVDYIPLFALNPQEYYRPYRALGEVLRVFAGTKNGWGLAFWFAGLNSFLDDRRPQDLLVEAPTRVIAAARAETEGVQHG
jgi:hypothetical protein